MKYGSVCSGVEAASIAWEPLGWSPVFFSEIEPFPSAVLEHHWPSVPNHGDMTKFEEWGYESGDIDVLVGGTPCQSFSIAGLRGGLEDDRGNLALTYMRMVDRLRPRWTVWENVPGVLSSNGGRDFGSIVGALAELGYSCAWRVLDAQNFGVPQRRRRVFLVGCASGDWRDPASVLFEQSCGNRDLNQSRKAREEAPKSIRRGVASGKHQFGTLMANCGTKLWLGNQEAFSGDYHILEPLCFEPRSQDGVPRIHGTVSPTLNTAQGGQRQPCVVQSQARRLTPVECERLQGFPDAHTDIGWKGKPTPDSHRYKAMGNSMAVPVMRWIGERIKAREYVYELQRHI